jgi:hypothetical protein
MRRLGCMHAQAGFSALIYSLSGDRVEMVKSLMRSRKPLNLAQRTKKDNTNALLFAIVRSAGYPGLDSVIAEMIDFASTSGQTGIFFDQNVRRGDRICLSRNRVQNYVFAYCGSDNRDWCTLLQPKKSFLFSLSRAWSCVAVELRLSPSNFMDHIIFDLFLIYFFPLPQRRRVMHAFLRLMQIPEGVTPLHMLAWLGKAELAAKLLAACPVEHLHRLLHITNVRS